MSIEIRLQKLLLPVFGVDTIDAIPLEKSLVRDLGADSLDFVEIVYLIEKEFKVKLETREIVSGGTVEGIGPVFREGALAEEGVRVIRERLPFKPERFRAGMTKMDIFQCITVADIAHIIQAKTGGAHAEQ
jgi:acyl carrier protein